MADVIRFHQTGDPEVLCFEKADIGLPGPGQVRLRQVAAGLNFADTYFRRGLYPTALPSGIGTEAAGIVEAVGDGVSKVKVGDRVTYTGAYNTLGAYASERIIGADPLIRLPAEINFETAAAMTMRGLTAAYLLRRICVFQAGDTLLLHAAAGGVGLIVSQWAKLLGLTVIGTASTDAKAEIARAHGCAYTINYSREDVAQRVLELTNGVGVHVVFDSVGAATYRDSIKSLRKRGLLVNVGAASGPMPAIEPMQLAMNGSLFFTRPMMGDYLSDPVEKAELANELFEHVANGRIKITIHQHYALREARQAHCDLEARQIVGSSIFMV